MDEGRLLRLLPESAPDKIIRFVRDKYPHELGGNMLIWKATRVRTRATMDELFQNSTKGGTTWAAEATCTACGESFITAGGGSSFWIASGEDGASYTVDPDIGQPEANCFCDVIEVTENDRADCPYCGSPGTAIHAKRIRGGRTKRVMVESVEIICEYAVIMYWMVENYITEYGSSCSAYPAWAYVITETGGIKKFARITQNMFGAVFEGRWRLCSAPKDTIDNIYADWGSITNKKQGVILYKECPDLTGTTGEKTALAELVQSGRTEYLVRYIKLWRRWKAVEVLAREGFARLIEDVLVMAPDMLGTLDSVVDKKERKPNRILRMGKAEYRQHIGKIRYWGLYEFRAYRNAMKKESMDLGRYIEMVGWFRGRLQTALDLGDPIEKTYRYLKKKQLTPSYVQHLVDVRRMVRILYGRTPTPEEMWPKDLIRMHDELMEMVRAQRDAKAAQMYEAGFRDVKAKYAQLEWTDGDLIMLLPISNGDLIREGDILRHCVGGYGEKHIAGTDTIFFVRHRRRPERPYYTLDIRMNSEHPYEVQLHGYGNERHGKNKEYSHRIPRKVREFCDRWKREVLAPYVAQQRKLKDRKDKTA